MESENRRRWDISKKTLVGIIVFTLFMSVFMCLSGSFLFDRVIQRVYNERGYVVANIIIEHIDHDKIAEYSKSWKADDYYYEMVDYLKYIQACSDAAYIYIGVPYEDHTIKYIYDSGSTIGFVDPIAAPFDEIWESYTKGVRPKSYLVRHSQYGFLTSSCLPIRDSDGNVVALLFVDTNMGIIYSTLGKFIINMSVIALLLMSIYCVITWKTLRKYIINPLIFIRDNLNHFAEYTSVEDNLLEEVKSNDELMDLAVSVSNMERDIVAYINNIQDITAERERIGAELNVATRIQADMLPRQFPPFPDRHEFDIFASMTPAKEVGGDFYDFFLIDDNHIGLVMADVAGKGVPAALFMVIAKTLIKNRTIMGGELSPAKIFVDVNNQLCEGNDSDMFVTVWFAIIDISTGKGVAANAGHEHPAVRRGNGKFEYVIYKHSSALAVMPGLSYSEHEFELNPGDSIFVYTDGVTEATDVFDNMYGMDRLIDALNEEPTATPEKLIDNVKTSIDKFALKAAQFDDITMLGFTYNGSEKKERGND